jgi:hypothetical protein
MNLLSDSRAKELQARAASVQQSACYELPYHETSDNLFFCMPAFSRKTTDEAAAAARERYLQRKQQKK